MDGDILRLQGNGLPQTVLKALHRISGQTGNEVHVDILVPGAAGIGIAIQNVLCRVLAANVFQHRVREGLGVDGDAGSAVFLDDRQLFGVGAIRATCLHGIFYDLSQVKILPHSAHELPQLGGGKAGGGAAADVDAA